MASSNGADRTARLAASNGSVVGVVCGVVCCIEVVCNVICSVGVVCGESWGEERGCCACCAVLCGEGVALLGCDEVPLARMWIRVWKLAVTCVQNEQECVGAGDAY